MSDTAAVDTAPVSDAGAAASESTISLDDFRASFEAEHGLSDDVTPSEEEAVDSGQEQPEEAQEPQGQLDPEPEQDNSKKDEPQSAGDQENRYAGKFKSDRDLEAGYLNLEKHAGQLANAKAALEQQLRQVQELQRFQQATAGGFDGLTPEQQAYYEQKAEARNYAKTAEQLYWDDVDRHEADLRRNLEMESHARNEAVARCGQHVQTLPDHAKTHVQQELDKLAEAAPEFDSALWSGMRSQAAQQFFTRFVDALKAEAELAKLKAEEPKKLALAKEEALREHRELRGSKRASATAARGTPAPATPNRATPKAGESAIDELYRFERQSSYSM